MSPKLSEDLKGLILCLLSESILAEVQKKITDAFSLFDNDSNETVDVRSVSMKAVFNNLNILIYTKSLFLRIESIKLVVDCSLNLLCFKQGNWNNN